MANPSTRTTDLSINQSSFKLYSMGIVANNKQLNSPIIEAVPIEDSMGLSGELTDHIYEFKSRGYDANNKAYETIIKTAATIKCEWLGLGDSNRMTAPDVRRGELVRIYRVANSEKFYWETTGAAYRQRRLETVVHAFSATKEEDVELNEENSYVTEINTHKKLVRIIHTTMANEEPYAYDFFFNTNEGQVVLKDNIGNMFLLTSKDNQLVMKNKVGTMIEIKGDTINIVASGGVNINSPTTNMSGNNNVGGTMTGGKVKQGGVELGTHTHSGRGSGRPYG